MKISEIPVDVKLSIHNIKEVTYLATGWWEYPNDRLGAVLWKAAVFEVRDGTLVQSTTVTVKPKELDTIYVDAEPVRALVARRVSTRVSTRGMVEPRRFVKYWEVVHTSGFKMSGNNMSELVKQNSKLFEPKDLVWKKSGCNATSKLYQLFAKKWTIAAWKGWTAIRKLDEPPSRKA